MRRPARDATAMTSSSVGTVSPVTTPALSLRRRALSSTTVRSLTAPWPFVVRSSVGSWMTITSPSLDRWTSNSMKSAPRATAFRKARRLFSGQRRAPPRCAASSVVGFPCAPPEPATMARPKSAQPAIETERINSALASSCPSPLARHTLQLERSIQPSPHRVPRLWLVTRFSSNVPFSPRLIVSLALGSSHASARTSFLALDEALHEPALHEDDDGHGRKEGHHGPGHDEVPGGQLGTAARNQLLEADDHRPHRLGVGDEERPQVLVPAEDEEHHEERGDVRPRQGQEELEEEADGPGAVELRGLGQLVGNGHVELTEEERGGGRGHERDGQPL